MNSQHEHGGSTHGEPHPEGDCCGVGDDFSPRVLARRFWISLGLSIPVVILAMGGMVLPAGTLPPQPIRGWVEFAFSTVVLLWCGSWIFRRGWQSLTSRKLNMFTLLSLGIGAAYCFSVASLLLPLDHGEHGPALYFEAAAVITTLVLLGQWMEGKAESATGRALDLLLGLAPPTAIRIDPDGDHEVAVSEIRPGDRIRVKPGEKLAADGTIETGFAEINEAMLTGEPGTKTKREGDRVTGGTINEGGAFVFTVDRTGDETTLAQIIRMVSDARASKAPIQRIVDRVSAVFVPTVLGIAALTFVAWATWGGESRFEAATVNAVAVLIIACPCALGIATPISVMVGIGRAAQFGLLVRSGASLERAAHISHLVTDKTGTLTEGKPRVEKIHTFVGSSDELLAAAAALELASEHPIARALVTKAKETKIPLQHATEITPEVGEGISGIVHDKSIRIGRAEFVTQDRSQFGEERRKLERDAQQDGKTTIWLSVDQIVTGLIIVADAIKPGAPDALAALRGLGVTTTLATGDQKATAANVAKLCGVEHVESKLTPADKARLVTKLQAEGHVVAMAGDGINDAPALASADVGIAMGDGTDIAIANSDVTAVGGDLSAIVRLVALARMTMRNIRENLAFAFAYNVIGIFIATGALAPITGWTMNPMLAAAAMSLSSICVIGNALRLGTYSPPSFNLKTAF